MTDAGARSIEESGRAPFRWRRRVSGTGEGQIRHHFTVDVEESFHASALEPWVNPTSWGQRESRVRVGVHRILELLDRHGSTGTFFMLGWVAQHHPGLSREIVAAGHEVASHGWAHERVTQLGPAAFRRSIRRTKRLLEDQTGQAVLGYRAPSFSIIPGREWALDVLIEEGHRYDSSLFPVPRRGYGYPSGRRDLHRLSRPAGELIELPPATLQVWGRTLPAGGGAYFRLLPYTLVRSALRSEAARGRPATFYVHPWEVDAEQPRIAVGAVTRLRHYGGIGHVHARLARLLAEFRFRSIAATLASLS